MKNLFNKIVNVEWTRMDQRYKINWPAVIIIGGAFLIVGVFVQ